MLVLIIYFFVGESATVAAAEGSTAVATFPKAVGRWKSESCPPAGYRWQGGQQIFLYQRQQILPLMVARWATNIVIGGKKILLSVATNIAIIVGKVGNKKSFSGNIVIMSDLTGVAGAADSAGASRGQGVAGNGDGAAAAADCQVRCWGWARPTYSAGKTSPCLFAYLCGDPSNPSVPVKDDL